MYQFIQVTARKENGDFALCSNLSMMDYQKVSPADAEILLQEMAAQYAHDGYDVEWTREDMGKEELEFWKPLFDRAAA